jgi:uncharacterized protein YegJ (DUF2314 family)
MTADCEVPKESRAGKSVWRCSLERRGTNVKYHFTTILASGLLAASGMSARADHTLAREDLKPRVFNVDKTNHEMRRAVRQARRTVGVFIRALQKPKPGEHDFEVKKPFRQGDGFEHLWLSDVTFSGNRFHGYVDNRPVKIKGLKMGDRVSVNPNEISDWAFVENGRLIGGYTIRVMYAELPPDQKAALEKEARFRITSFR